MCYRSKIYVNSRNEKIASTFYDGTKHLYNSLQFCFVNSLLQSGLNSLHHIESNGGAEKISEDCSVKYNSCKAIDYTYCWKI